jgi:c-di-GMP-related signal transduction protein
MNPFRDKSPQPEQQSLFKRNPHPHDGGAAAQTSEYRQFSLQPIVGPRKQAFGSEALFCAGVEDPSNGDPNIASRIMLDNWLLYGFEELIGGHAVFLNCTRETLLSGFLSLLPHSAVFEIQETVEADEEVLAVCRSLKAAGYRFALDDFESLENMEHFLDLADFIKVDFQHSGRRKRACMLRDLKLTGATLIADRIESEEDFRQAVEEGFGLFQGYWAGESTIYLKKADPLDPMQCTCILGALEEPIFAADEVAELVNLESGIECRLLRRANWESSSNLVINSARDAYEAVGKPDLQKIVTIAMTATSEEGLGFRSASRQGAAMNARGADALVQWMEMGSPTPWWCEMGEAAF